MKPIAEWIREQTPGWSEESRHLLTSRVHVYLPPVCLFLFVFTENVFIRFFVLCLQIVTLVSEFVLHDCIVTMVEREFSDTRWNDLFSTLLKANGWDITRGEKMTFNIGLNVGLLIMSILILLRQSVLWIVGFTGIAVTALPSLMLLSRTHHLLPSVELPPH